MQAKTDTQLINLRISGISCTNLPRVRFRHGTFYITATIGKEEQKTKAAERSNNPSWDETLDLSVSELDNLVLEVMAQHTFGKDKSVCRLESPVKITLDPGHPESFPNMPLVDKNNKKAGVISFIIEHQVPKHSSQESLREQSLNAHPPPQGWNETSKKVGNATGSVSGLIGAAKEVASIYGPWKTLMDKIGIVVEIGDKIAEIHPYSQMAWKIISPALQALATQVKRDKTMDDLIGAMEDMYNYYLEIKKLLRAEELGRSRFEIVRCMFRETQKCGWFIYDYTSRGFAPRMIKATTSDHDSTVKRYIDTFQKLKECFKDQSTLVIESTIHEVLTVVHQISDEGTLNRLAFARQDLPKGCLTGTREMVLNEIKEWIQLPPQTPEEERHMYWLHGVAGCGKSAIASTIVETFQSMVNCAWFFFSTSRQDEAGPGHMLSTLSRGLADVDVEWKKSLVEIARGSRQLQETRKVKDQFENFILRTAETCKPIGPVLVVIDALDECGSDEQRAQLLEMLGRLDELKTYGYFRFLVTSRPDEDIRNVFDKKPWIRSRDLAKVETSSTDADIRSYVDSVLSSQQQLLQEWPEKPWVDVIVSRANHLFQWVFVACSFIKSGRSPVKRYVILRDDRSDARLEQLHRLYRTVLQNIYDEDDIPLFRTILGRILSAREPLSLGALIALRNNGEREYEIRDILRPLSSLLQGIECDNEPIRPLHTSFNEFLQDSSRSNSFHVQKGSEDKVLSKSCLREMNNRLHFNMCHLESSYVRNRDIADLKTRVKKNIPECLSYACRHFADHLNGLGYDPELQTLIEGFLYHKLLFWLEALSLLGDTYPAQIEMLTLQAWIKEYTNDDDLGAFTADAERFVRIYSGMMATSTPHIYLSSLAFIPPSSPLHKTYLKQHPGGIKVAPDVGSAVSWTSLILEIKLSETVLSARCSPNGKYIASESEPKGCTLRVWDIHTGHLVVGPFEGHTKCINSVEFSQDSERIVSGSEDCTIRVWDALTGQPIAGPFEGHTDGVRSVAFSPDGKYIISGSDDCTIRVWDALTGKAVTGPYKGHTSSVLSVGFSPDGQCIVSGSKDCTIRVWDTLTGQPIADPCKGHADWVRSVGFSPDGKYIVSGSDDNTIRVWDTLTGQLSTGPLEGHTSRVNSVGFSPDGNYIVSGSNDKTIRVWGALAGQHVSGLLKGHAGYVNSVQFSPDGKYIISGSDDCTIRVWDVNIGQPDAGQHNVYPGPVKSIGFSPDGKCIVSGSSDNTIHIWDALTGQLVSGPFKGHTDSVNSVGFSPDGKYIVSGSDDCTIRAWDALTGQLVTGPLEGHARWVLSVGFSPDGKYIVSGSSDKTIRVWDVLTGELAADPLEGHAGEVNSVGFSPDGKYIVSGSDDCTIRVWDALTGRLVSRPFKGHDGLIWSVGFSPDGQYIVSGSDDCTIRVWDALTGKLVAGPFQGHTSWVQSVGFSPDGQYIVSGSDDRSIRVWDTRTGKLAAGPFEGHHNCVNSVMFSPDGKYIVSGSNDSTIRAWEVDTRRLSSNPSNDQISSCHSAIQYTDSSRLDDDGWMCAPSGELVFWVPPVYRLNLCKQSNTLVIAKDAIKLDLSRFMHGREWEKCCVPQGDM